MRTLLVPLVSVLALPLLVGCSPSPASPSEAPVADLVAAKCGSCHLLPKPARLGAAQAAEWRVAHQKRVRLEATEWAALEGYLTAPSAAEQPPR